MNARRCGAVLAVVAVLAAGCSLQPGVLLKQAADPPAQATSEIWEYPAAAYPAVCLILDADGSLRFRGGFLFFNPGRWRRDVATGTTSLVLGGNAPFPIEAVHRQSQEYAAAIAPFDPGTRTLRYRIAAADRALEFAGLVFRRSATCSAI